MTSWSDWLIALAVVSVILLLARISENLFKIGEYLRLRKPPE